MKNIIERIDGRIALHGGGPDVVVFRAAREEIERLRKLCEHNERHLSAQLRRRGLLLHSDPYANLEIVPDPEYVPGKPQD